MQPSRKITTFALTLLITGSIDSIRNLPATALFGSTLIFFFIFAAVFFLIPTALVSAELTANIGEGGIYQWTRRAFGEKAGFLAVWLQWINVVVWLPTVLSFIAGTAAYLIDPALAQNRFYLIGMILAVFWFVTFINLRSIHVSSRFAALCAMAGLILPMVLIISLLAIWVMKGNPVQIHFTAANMLPEISRMDNWIALTAIMLGFAGMELATVHINEVENPSRSFPRALTYSSIIILITMILGSLAIALVLPADKINLLNGTVQTFSYFLNAYHMSWLVPVLTLLLVIGSLGGIINWVAAPARGLAQAAEHGYLPAFFAAKNRHGISQNLLIFQAVLVSIVSCLFLCFPGVNASYWLLTALSTQVYMVMYIFIFISALKLRFTMDFSATTFTIPGKKVGTVAVCTLGLAGCLITLFVGFIPPANINIGSKVYYELVFCGGILAMMLPALVCYRYK